MSAVNASSSDLPPGLLRWVERCWSRTFRAKGSDTENFAITDVLARLPDHPVKRVHESAHARSSLIVQPLRLDQSSQIISI